MGGVAQQRYQLVGQCIFAVFQGGLIGVVQTALTGDGLVPDAGVQELTAADIAVVVTVTGIGLIEGGAAEGLAVAHTQPGAQTAVGTQGGLRLGICLSCADPCSAGIDHY